MKAIPFNKLPQTHKDAIAVCKALGFRYNWIDALCIIQDSENDKEEEIAKMGSIYHGSTFTIDANAGGSAHSGLYAHRNPLWYSPCKLDIAIPSQGEIVHEVVYAYPYIEPKRGTHYSTTNHVGNYILGAGFSKKKSSQKDISSLERT
jgi:hypothetical protein